MLVMFITVYWQFVSDSFVVVNF